MSDLRNKALSILLSEKYSDIGGVLCAEYVLKDIKKDPWRKGKQFGTKNKPKSVQS